MNRLWEGLEHVVVHRILGLDDTPHRIAWGVLLGTFITFTPTLGFQIALYIAAATLLRANKISGIPVLFVSNPFTAVPLYYFVWRTGSLLVPGKSGSGIAMRRRLKDATGSEVTWSEAATIEFWVDIGRTVIDMGIELWIGALALGLLAGIPAFFVSYWGVMEHRRRTWHRRRLHRDRK